MAGLPRYEAELPPANVCQSTTDFSKVFGAPPSRPLAMPGEQLAPRGRSWGCDILPAMQDLDQNCMAQEARGRGRSAETGTKAYQRHVAGTIGEIRGDMQVRLPRRLSAPYSLSGHPPSVLILMSAKKVVLCGWRQCHQEYH